MMFIFDTSAIIALEREDKKALNLVSELLKKQTGPPQASFVVYDEFLYGIKNRAPHNQLKAIEFLNNFNCIPATRKTAEILSGLRHDYERKGILINPADMIIASHAKEHNLTLVTADRIFEKIDDINKIIIDLKQ